ncbi:MAG: alpha/beta fold hydrolase [Chloroflexota bacterium]
MTQILEKLGRFFNGRSAQDKTLKVNGERLPYLEINVPEEKGVPILIGIHGFGADESQMQTLVNIKLSQPYIYIALRGFYKHPTGGFAWFPIEVDAGNIQFDRTVVAESLAKIDAFIKTAVLHYEADPTNVFFVGYSQGGASALSYLLRHPETVKGVVSTAGNLLETSVGEFQNDALREKSLFIGFGTLDPLINQEQIEDIKTEFETLGVDVVLKSYKIPHVVSQTEVQDIQDWLERIISK